MIKKCKKYGVISLFAVAILMVTSCEKWLSVSPKTQLKAEDMLSNETGYDDLLTGVYATMTTEGSYGSFLTFSYLDALGQYYSSPMASGATQHVFKYSVEYNFKEGLEESRASAIWSVAYRSIVNLNSGLKYIDQYKDVFSSESVYNIYKGEFLGLRAMLHFDILRLFAQSPAMNNGGGMNSLAIPYFDKYTNVAQPQGTVREVLDKIITDLKAAKELMAPYDPYGPISDDVVQKSDIKLGSRNYRMNYYAVTALLARVYLYAGEKENALAQTKEIVLEPTSGAPKKLFKMATEALSEANWMFFSEDIFALNVVKLEPQTKAYFIEGQSAQSVLTLSNEEHQVYFDRKGSSSDFRANWFKTTKTSTEYILAKYDKQTSIPLLTVSEVYLIAAECAEGTDGVSYLNTLRAHRGLEPISESDDLMTEIFKEFRREMIGNGQLFFFHKRNLSSTLGFLENVKVNNLQTAFVLPIPQLEIEFGKIKN